MNEMNQLENQLRSWAPRHPSAKLELTLFGRQTELASEAQRQSQSRRQGFHFGWFAPVTAGFVLMCMLFNQRHGSGGAGGTNAGNFLAVISSNQGSYLIPGIRTQQESHPSSNSTFDWTNESSFPSSVRSFFGPKAQH